MIEWPVFVFRFTQKPEIERAWGLTQLTGKPHVYKPRGGVMFVQVPPKNDGVNKMIGRTIPELSMAVALTM